MMSHSSIIAQTCRALQTLYKGYDAISDMILETSLSEMSLWESTSVTRLGDLVDFGQLFKAFGNN